MRTFWSLNEDILKITILKTNTPYPSRKIRRIRACTHQSPQINTLFNLASSVRHPTYHKTTTDQHIRDYCKPSHEGYRNTIELPVGNNVVPLRSDTIRLVQNGCLFHGLRFEDPNQHLKNFLKLVDSLDFDGENKERMRLRTIDQSASGKLRDLNAKESWALLEDLALYDNESWNDPRDFAKPVKAITLPQDVPSTSDRCLIELENQIQRLMEAHLAPTEITGKICKSFSTSTCLSSKN
ncbi:hypothetical protein Tco_1001886 [Tanacetum coccineum]